MTKELFYTEVGNEVVSFCNKLKKEILEHLEQRLDVIYEDYQESVKSLTEKEILTDEGVKVDQEEYVGTLMDGVLDSSATAFINILINSLTNLVVKEVYDLEAEVPNLNHYISNNLEKFGLE